MLKDNIIVRIFKRKIRHGIFIYALIIGLASGIVSMFFSIALDFFETFFFGLHEQTIEKTSTLSQKFTFITQHPKTAVMILLLPAVGGLLAGFIIQKFCKEASGTGTDEMIDAFHNKEGKIEPKTPFFKAIATLLTLSTGGSGGKEGPISLIGAGIGVAISNVVNAGARARRTLMLAGTAAGLGAVFKTPLGGALTAAEMVYKEDIESDALIPCFISSVTAYLVYIAYAGTGSYLATGSLTQFNVSELVYYFGLGVLCFLFGHIFIKSFSSLKTFFSAIPLPVVLKPAIGGLLTGLIALLFFETAGTGHSFLTYTLKGSLPDFFGTDTWISIIISILLIVVLKILATGFTIASGGSAGIFGPSLFIGALLGAAVGVAARNFLDHPVSIASFVVVGMGAFYAGVANAPIAGIIMIVEMTGSYVLLPPLILVSIFTFILSKQITFYKSQVENRFKSPAHAWDMQMDIIESIVVKNYFPEYRLLAVVEKNTPMDGVFKLGEDIHASDFVVVSAELRYEGMLSLRRVKVSKQESFIVSRFTDKSVPGISPDDKLSKALQIIIRFDVDKVAVVDSGRTLGYIRSRDIFQVYTEQMNKKNSN